MKNVKTITTIAEKAYRAYRAGYKQAWEELKEEGTIDYIDYVAKFEPWRLQARDSKGRFI